MGQYVQNPDGTHSQQTVLTGSNPQDAKTPGSGDINALHSGFNGANWDRWRNNTEGTILANAARTSSATGPNMTNHNARGVLITLNVTAASATGGLQLIIEGRDSVSASPYWLHPAPTAITAVGIYVYAIYPGATQAGVAGSARVQNYFPAILPRTWFAFVAHGDATSYTYSVGFSLIL